jgi:CysZ protein
MSLLYRNNPMIGFGYFVDGFRLITKPGVKRFVIIPLIINILFFIGLFFLLRHYVSEFDLWLVNHVPAWLQWLAHMLGFLFLISFILLFVFTFVVVANMIAAPFNGFLAEKVELYLKGSVPEPRTLWEDIRDVPRILSRQLSVLGYFLPRALLLFILFFIPLVQIIAPILWFLFSAWFMTMTYIDYPSDNHRVSVQAMRLWLKQKRWVSLGFGVSVLVASMIPLLNFFTIPAAVAGATKFWLNEADTTNLSS